MKKIINGRRYDTGTAKKMAEWDNGQFGNFGYCSETLYRKNTGEYFLHGEGGANSRYARRIESNCWGSGEAITPLTLQEAQEWAEANLDGDEYEEVFGVVEETETKRTATFSLSEAAIDKIARLAAEKEISKSEVIEWLLTLA